MRIETREILAHMVEEHRDPNLGVLRDVLHNDQVAPLERDLALVIQGVRRCGKSTLLRQIAAREDIVDRSIFINFEDPRFSDRLDYRLLDEVVEFHEGRSKRNRYFFLDEIQNVAGWEKWLHIQLERKQRFFVITGSNYNLLGGELSSALTGRHISLELFPFSFAEFRRAKPRGTFHDYLERGGFPRPLMSAGGEALLREYFIDIIERDVRRHVSARSTVPLAQIAKATFEAMGSELSLRNLAASFATTADTVKTYITAFELAYLAVSCPFFTFSERKSQVRPRKYYPIDLGLRNVIVSTPGRDLGKKLECAVLHHLRRSFRSVCYWRGRGEVDFVVQTPRGLLPIQVSHGDEKTRHIAAVEEFAREHPGTLAPKFIDEARAEKLFLGKVSLDQV
jgi:predicted AAA+ superfamily ATPase